MNKELIRLAIAVIAFAGVTASQSLALEAENLTVTTNITQTSASGTVSFQGKVGAGTSSPDEQLHVDGKLRVSGQGSRLYLENESGNSDTEIRNTATSGQSNFRVRMGGTTRFFVDHWGQVAILPPSASEALYVKMGSAAQQVYIQTCDSWFPGIRLQRGGSTNDINAYVQLHTPNANQQLLIKTDTGDIELGASGNDGQVFLKSDGNVGIGTTSPDAMLDVENSAGAKIQLSADAGAWDSRMQFIDHSSQEWCIGGRDADGSFRIADYQDLSSGVRLVIDSAGEVGIGTNSPNETLHVAGTLRADQGITYIAPLGDLSMGSYTNNP